MNLKKIHISKFTFKKPSRKRLLLSFLLFSWAFIATYILLLIFAPQIDYYLRDDVDKEVQQIQQGGEINLSNGIIIPKIKAAEPILEGGEEVLNQGVWHRKPTQGDPVIGGNFILTGHRFNLTWTPGQVAATSPFYHIDKLEAGDIIYIIWNKKAYEYKVESKKKVKPDEIEIENQTEEPQLTLYTCTLGGRKDGREVIIAKPI